MRIEEAPFGSYVDMQIVSPVTAEVLSQVAGQPPFIEQVAVASLLPADATRHHDAIKIEAARLYSTRAVRVMGQNAAEETVYYDAALRQLKAGMDIVQITVNAEYAGAQIVRSLWDHVAQRQTAHAARMQSRSPLIGP